MFFAISSVVLGAFVYLKRPDDVGKLFLAFSLACGGWGVGNWWIYTNDTEYLTALWGTRIAHFCAILIPAIWLHFTCVYLNYESQKQKLILGFYCCSIFLLFFAGSHLFIPQVKSIVGFKYYTSTGPIYHIFTVEFFTAVSIAFIFLFQGLQKAIGERKEEIRIVFIATLIAFISGSLTFLPNYEIPFPQYNLFFMPLYPFMMAYAMTKRGFMDSSQVLAIHKEKLMLVGLMTASINHELRNPLFIARELTKKMKARAEEKGDDETLKSVETVTRHMERVGRLVERLREFGRPSDASHEKESVDLSKVIDDALFFVQQELRHQSVELKLDVPADLPPIQANKGQLEEVFLNLFMNALQAMPKGGVLSIVLRTSNIVHREKGNRSTKYEVQCTITDTGTGIPKDELKHIFTPFYTKKEKEGTGLGLYIVKSLVEQNNGKITVQSEVGKGTSFQLIFSLK